MDQVFFGCLILTLAIILIGFKIVNQLDRIVDVLKKPYPIDDDGGGKRLIIPITVPEADNSKLNDTDKVVDMTTYKRKHV